MSPWFGVLNPKLQAKMILKLKKKKKKKLAAFGWKHHIQQFKYLDDPLVIVPGPLEGARVRAWVWWTAVQQSQIRK